MTKRHWIAIALAPVWIFAFRFAWLEAAPMSREVDDWLFLPKPEQSPVCPTHYDIAAARNRGLGDTEIADWFAAGCPSGGPAWPGESASESSTAADWEAAGGHPVKPANELHGTPVKPLHAPSWLKQAPAPSWALKPQKVESGPWTKYQHKPNGKEPTLVPIEGDPPP